MEEMDEERKAREREEQEQGYQEERAGETLTDSKAESNKDGAAVDAKMEQQPSNTPEGEHSKGSEEGSPPKPAEGDSAAPGEGKH
ncbi:hypothetical protein PHISCL_11180 [Aspergillus sclerotialis]|uniref:Uncharacterized protein n=1 Tax=Aspergillus sclerotialis TaxID=2070753 RepID=A0A3A2Z2P7_9EURO|nr:hypothetical protein PHISCL_11180 [Aspergillus sclerotialis]